ncbi:MAG: isoaspartyl peptidase/L-asparaginase, partial [Bacteroidota bacterium]
MNNRRKFLKQLSGLAAMVGLPTAGFAAADLISPDDTNKKKGTKKGKHKQGAPMIVTTWNFGLQANETAWPTLASGGRALDAIEQGIRQCENDPTERSVGFGGRPDRDGHVTLDACIMDEKGNIGSVVCMEHIANPISVARAVMEKTPHVMLAG